MGTSFIAPKIGRKPVGNSTGSNPRNYWKHEQLAWTLQIKPVHETETFAESWDMERKDLMHIWKCESPNSRPESHTKSNAKRKCKYIDLKHDVIPLIFRY